MHVLSQYGITADTVFSLVEMCLGRPLLVNLRGSCSFVGIQWKLVASLLKIPMDSNEMRSVRLFHQRSKLNDVSL